MHGSRRFRGRRIVVALGCLVGSVVASGAANARPGPPPGPLEVRVLSEPDRHPLAGIVISAGGRYVSTAPDGVAVFDGLPAGSYTLAIDAARFERLRRVVTVPPGRREPVQLVLRPVVPVPLELVVALQDTNVPVPGAELQLVPHRVAAAVSGPIVGSTDRNGRMRVLAMAPGSWRLRVSAPGCADAVRTIEVRKGVPPVRIGLRALEHRASLAVTVRDARSGRPVPGAEVQLAACWPAAPIASARTDAAGGCRFDALRVGTRTVRGARGQAVRISERLTAHVEAPGYRPRTAAVWLRGETRCEVALDPTAPVTPPADAGDRLRPIDAPTGAPVPIRLDVRGAQRWVRWRLPVAARARLVLEAAPIETYLALRDETGRVLAGRGARAGQPNHLEDELPRGTVWASVEEWGRNAATDKPLTLRLLLEDAVDPYEPNDERVTARSIHPGQAVYGLLFPRGEVDLYTTRMPRRGTLHVHLDAHPIERFVRVLDEQDRVVGARGAMPGKPLELGVDLGPGRYTIEVTEWGRNASSLVPYRLQIERVLEDPAAGPRRLGLGARVGATLLPVGDVDRYALTLPSAGRLTVRARAPIECYLTLREPHTSRVLAGRGALAKRENTLVLDAAAGGLVWLDCEEWGRNGAAASPYTLETQFDPVDENERIGRNETPATASPLALIDPMRGTIEPLGDRDVYRFEIDHPGRLRIRGHAPLETYLTVRDPEGRPIGQRGTAAGDPVALDVDVGRGPLTVAVEEWGGNGRSPASYELHTELVRAEPAETDDMRHDPVRRLPEGRARAFAIDRLGDRDRFAFEVATAGPVLVELLGPIELYALVRDERTGAVVAQGGKAAQQRLALQWKAPGAARYSIEVGEWGDNGRSDRPCLVRWRRDTGPVPLVSVETQVAIDPLAPREAVFSTPRPLEGTVAAERVEIDADGDGRHDVTLRPGQTARFTYAREGVYAARVRATGRAGAVSEGYLWVEAVGPHERTGVRLVVDEPHEGAQIDRNVPARVRAFSYAGAPIREVLVYDDGRRIGRAVAAPFTIELPWDRMAPGPHTLRFEAVSARGERARLERTVRVSEYLELSPPDGAVCEGEWVRVSWRSARFGPARVRYRRKDAPQAAWSVAEGEPGRLRTVALRDLEPDVPYVWQPLGAGDPGPERVVTRVRGLTFAARRFGATIARDYGQRIAIAVRNQSDVPRTVRVACGDPEPGSRLLVGFVGLGDRSRPVQIAPGEQEVLQLGLSAQDVVRPLHRFTVRLEDERGRLLDTAEVEVRVRLPEVKLAWLPGERSEDGLGQRFVLRNDGDDLTDLEVTVPDSVIVSPEVHHGALARGERIELDVRPRLYEGFEAVRATLTARAIGTSCTATFEAKLPEGQRLYEVRLGMALDEASPPAPGAGGPEALERLLLRARRLAATVLDPAPLDWSLATNPRDVDGDGIPDRWEIDDELENVRWVGEDADGDGTVDAVRADVGRDGVFDYAGFRTESGWQRSPVLEAALELRFRLPWRRDAYRRHDVDVLVGDRVVGRLRSVIPEGSYRFPVPLSALPATGDLEAAIHSRHLNGGHYIVTSDFRWVSQLVETSAWIAAADRESAERRARTLPGLVLDAPDPSVSRADCRIEPGDELRAGQQAEVVAEVRNLGAVAAYEVEVALRRARPTGGGFDVLARERIPELAAGAAATVVLPWRAQPGASSLQVCIDPDGLMREIERENDVAVLPVVVTGEATDAPPELRFLADPQPGDTEPRVVTSTTWIASVQGTDDTGPPRLEARVDGGLWVALRTDRTGAARFGALLQPGTHRIEVRATDASGQQTVAARTVRVACEGPEVRWSEPAAGATVSERSVAVRAETVTGAALVAARVDGGPWMRLALQEGRIEGKVTLRHGPQRLELIVADRRGAVTRQVRTLRCTRALRDEQEARAERAAIAAATREGGWIELPRLGRIDLFAGLTQIVARLPEDAAGPGTAGDEGGGAAGGQGAPSGTAPSSCVAAFARQRSWYCTNRPRIRTRFRLPPWLRHKRLPPPGTRAFDRMIEQLLARLRARGIDTSGLERLQQIILARIGRLEGPAQLPSFLASLGFAAPEREDPEALARWRETMAARARAWWLRLLASQDPSLIERGLRARLAALRGYDEGAALAAEAAIESIHAHQKLVEDVAGVLPLVGDAMDIVALARGETLAGDRMSTLDYVLTSVGLVGGEVLQHWLRGRETRRALESIAQKAAVLDGAQRAALARQLGISREALERGLRKIDRALEASRHAELSRLDALAREGREAFEASAEAVQDAARFAADTRQAQRQLEALAEAAARGDRDALRRAVLDWQKNKTAQALLLEGKDLPEAIARRGPAFREQLLEEVARELDGVYREVDRGVARTLRESEEIRALARKRGLDPDAIEIEPLTITNKRPGQSAARPRPGRDRDVTYRIVQRMPDGSERAIDVPHEIARSVYERELWLRTRGEPLPDAKTLERYAESLDQTVTSRTHVEAYNPGEVALKDFLDKGKTPTLTRVEDVVDTVEYKATHWFERARHNPDPIAASREVAEGMRQATKQYRDIVLSRVRQYYGDRWRLHVPPRLEKGMEIFDRVVRREITPAQAEAMLRRMGSSKEQVVRGMSMYLEALEKGPGHAWRKAQFPKVYHELASIPFDRNSKAWSETAFETVKRALAEGRLTGSDFLRLNGQIERKVLERLRRIPPAERPAARRWLESLLARRLIGRATFESLRRAVDAPPEPADESR